MSNRLNGALKNKRVDDEFYTRAEDINKFLPYWDLTDKIVYCPCDTEKSEFVKYFKQKGKCKKVIYTSDDFRNHEDLFRKADIIVTNPPFSLKIDFLNIIRKYKKDYILILSTISTMVYTIKELNNEIFIYKSLREFNRPDGSIAAVGCKWYSNIFNSDKKVYGNHNMTFSGNHKIEIDKNGVEYKFYNWCDVPKEIKGEFIVPVTYDSGYKDYFPNLKILEKKNDLFDKETGKQCFSRYLIKI